MPGPQTIAGGDQLWGTLLSRTIQALQDGWIYDDATNVSTGVVTTNATYATNTTFTVTGDSTAFYTSLRRLKVVHAGGTSIGEVASAVFAAGSTTVTIGNVTSGPTTMTSAITSAAVGFEFLAAAGNKTLPVAYFTLTDGATITPDAVYGTRMLQTVTLGAAGRTMANPTNARNGAVLILRILQDGTGSRTITTWGTLYKFAGGTNPTLTTTASKADIFGFIYDGTNWQEVAASQNL